MSIAKHETEVHGRIKWMTSRDAPEVLSIEHTCFEFPWTEEDFVRCLHRENCTGMVAEYKDQVIGFMIYKLHETRIHLLSLAVHPRWQRYGAGKQLIETLLNLEILEQHFQKDHNFGTRFQYIKHLILEVRETNLAAQLFFRECGFKATSVLRGHYRDTTEDAYVMQRRCRYKRRKPKKPDERREQIIAHFSGWPEAS